MTWDEVLEGTPWVTTQEAAEKMGIHYSHLRRKIAAGEIKEEYILRVTARQNLIHVKAIREYLAGITKHESVVRGRQKSD